MRVWTWRREFAIRSPRLVATVVFLAVAAVLLTIAARLFGDARRFHTASVEVPVVASHIVPAAAQRSTAYELTYRGPEQDQTEAVPFSVWEAAQRSGNVRLKPATEGRTHIWQPSSGTTIAILAGIGFLFLCFALMVASVRATSWVESRVAQVPFWTLFGSIWLSVGLPFVVMATIFGWQDWRLSTSGSEASGTVLVKEVGRSGSTSSGPTFRYTVHYRFEDTDRRVREGKSEVPEAQWAGFIEQQRVPIQHVPGSSLHRVAGAHERWTLAIFGGVGVLIGGAGALIIRADRRQRRKARRLEEAGVRTPARVLSVEPARLRVNREQLWKIRYEYRDREHQMRTGSTTVTADEAERWKTGDTAAILFDPAAPTSTVWVGQATESPA